MSIVDWYLIITPLFAIFILLTLITLKLSLKSQTEIDESAMKKLKAQQAKKAQGEVITPLKKYSTLRVLNFLIRNHTFLQFCFTRKSKNKLPTLLSFSIISGLCIVNPHIIINCVVGIPIVIGFFICQACFEEIESSNQVIDGQIEDFTYISQNVKKQDKIYLKNRYLFTFCGVITTGIYMYLCALTFKNYSNLFLSNFIKNVAVNCCADIFIVRLPVFLFFALPFSCNNKILTLIENQRLRQIYAQRNLGKDYGLKDCATNLSPRKKQPFSPTKVPKAVKKNTQNEALKNAMQVAKKIKRQRKQSEYLKKMNHKIQIENNKGNSQQYSINYLFEQNDNNQNKGRETPIASFEEDKQSSGYKTKRKETDLVIVQFKKNDQIEQVIKHSKKQSQCQLIQQDNFIQRKGGSFLHSNLDFQDDFNRRQDSQHPSQGENRLNIIKLLSNVYPDQQQNQQDEEDAHRIKKNQNFMTVDIGRNGHLHIDQNNQGVEQIDPNSPQRRRNKGMEHQDNTQFKLKKKKTKHFAGNSKRRVIKFSSGQPYLQYLPHMLQKNGSKHKKSQPIQHSKADLDFFEDRRKSIKKPKTKKQPRLSIGDENHYPGTMQALQVEDI